MKILIGGDLYLGDKNNIAQKDIFKNILSIRDEYDFFVCNLEGLISDKYENDTLNGIKLINSTNIIEILKYMRIDGVFLSNNHTNDYNVIDETLTILSKNNIMNFGIGYEDEIYKILNIKGEKVLISSMSEDIGGLKNYATKNKKSYILCKQQNLKKISEIKNIKNKIIYCHHGLMREYYPTENIRNSLLKYIDNFTLFCGSHAHHIMGIEKIKNKILAYGLGDFYFHNFKDEKNKYIYKNFKKSNYSFLLGVEIEEGEIIGYNIYPIFFNGKEIVLHNNLKRIKRLSEFKDFNFQKQHTRDNGIVNFFRYEFYALFEYIINIIKYRFKYEFLKSPGFRKIDLLNKIIDFIRKKK